MEKCHQENKNNSNIRRRKQDESNRVERVRKIGATSKADPVKVPLRYSKIPLPESLERPNKRKLSKNSSYIIFYKLSLEYKVLKNETESS